MHVEKVRILLQLFSFVVNFWVKLFLTFYLLFDAFLMVLRHANDWVSFVLAA